MHPSTSKRTSYTYTSLPLSWLASADTTSSSSRLYPGGSPRYVPVMKLSHRCRPPTLSRLQLRGAAHRQ